MEILNINLKICLPSNVFLERKDVKRMVVQTIEGSMGFLPNRLDCVAAIRPGILEYETESGGVSFLATDEGILVKTGEDLMISVRHAVGGADLGKLKESVDKTFRNLDEEERSVRTVMAKLEISFLQNLEKFHQSKG